MRAYIDIVCQHAAFRHYLTDIDLQEIGEFTRENVARFSNSRNRPYGWLSTYLHWIFMQFVVTSTFRGPKKRIGKGGRNIFRRDGINGWRSMIGKNSARV